MILPQTFLIGYIFSILLFLLFFTDIFSIPNRKLIYVLVVVLQIIGIAVVSKDIGDVMLFGSAGWFLRHKIDFYFIDGNHGSYPFLPFLIYIFAVANFLVETIKVFTFSFYLKIFELFCLYFIANFIKDPKSKLLFLVNPITYSVILFHGQIDVFLLALFFGASYFILNNRKNIVIVGVLMAASIAAKTWSVFLLPVVFSFLGGFRRVFIFASVIMICLLLNIYVYIHSVGFSSFRVVIPAAVLPGVRTAGDWGISLLPWFNGSLSKPLLILSFSSILLIQILYIRKVAIYWEKCLWVVLSLYIFLPSVAVQYFFWIIPFIFILWNKLNSSMRNIFILTITGYVGLSYAKIVNLWQINGYIIKIYGFAIWIYCIFWLLYMLRSKEYVKK